MTFTKKLKFGLLFSVTLSSVAGMFPGAIDIDHSGQWQDYKRSMKLPVTSCTVLRGAKSYHLNAKDSFDKSLDLISTFDKGAVLISSYKHKVEKGELVVMEFTQNVRDRLNVDKGVAALYVHEESGPSKIYIDSSDELGLLAIYVYHELSHAMDEKIGAEFDEANSLYNRYKTIYESFVQVAKGRGMQPGEYFYEFLNEDEKKHLELLFKAYNEVNQVNSYRAERAAFSAQDEFVEDLFMDDSCFSDYIEEHKTLNRLKLYLPTPDSHIFNSYGIDRDLIE